MLLEHILHAHKWFDLAWKKKKIRIQVVQVVPVCMFAHSHLELVTQDYIQEAFLQYFQGQRFCSLSGQPVPVHNKEMFSDAQVEPLCFNLGHHWKAFGSIFFAPCLQIFVHIDEIPPSSPYPLQAEQTPLTLFLLWILLIQDSKHKVYM